MKKNAFRLFVASVFSLVFFPAIAQKPASADPIVAGKSYAVVPTAYGKVRGYSSSAIFTFKGIPYAKAERFQPAQKPDAWQTVRSSMSYGPVCPTDATTTVMDEGEFPFQHNWGYTNEKCQSLNVWTPEINGTAKRPVMVWFHGGGFTAGSSVELPSYDGENLSRKGDVVVVTVNHRLNVLGFLDMSAYGEKYKSSGNAGLTDLVAALQWVKENIAAFGGDPNNVTIFGQSGGGGKVTSLMYAPSAKGLFHKAIVQSGSYLSGFMEPAVSRRITAATLEELNIAPTQADSLQKIPYDQLYAAAKKAMTKVSQALRAEGKQAGFFGWGPILDGDFLPYQPTDAAGIAIAKDVPLLVGTTKNEFTPFNPTLRNLSMEQVKENLQKQYKDKADAYMTAVSKAYPGNLEPGNYVDLDINFRAGAIRQADLKSSTGTAPVYMYLFSWQSPVMDGQFKAMHCMELPFVFDNIDRCREMTGGGKDAKVLADKMSQAWINFARTGDPNAKALQAWPKYTAENGATMFFDNKCEVRYHHDKELLQVATAK
ncbi:carboxylesterase/lipase family protein [Flavisolibacter nicotianae]|uniref:carboxylesterase/lipase family protein n=1 Tax=Flavisolibacter nicotianae TaxID=2364882 RepID=UPI000EACDF33|nr:carboxylesterase/lipase family protein [Flavisolibacter nicotianae]